MDVTIHGDDWSKTFHWTFHYAAGHFMYGYAAGQLMSAYMQLDI